MCVQKMTIRDALMCVLYCMSPDGAVVKPFLAEKTTDTHTSIGGTESERMHMTYRIKKTCSHMARKLILFSFWKGRRATVCVCASTCVIVHTWMSNPMLNSFPMCAKTLTHFDWISSTCKHLQCV